MAADDEAAKRFDDGLRNLDRAVEMNPNDWVPYAARSALAEKSGQSDRSGADMDAALRLGADGSVLIQMSQRLASRATATTEWGRVATLLKAAARDSSVAIDDLYALAVACMKAGDRTAYRAACAQITQRMPSAPTPMFMGDAIAATTAFSLGSGATDNWSVPLSWVARILTRLDEREAGNPSLKEGLKRWRRVFLHARGALLYRAGRLAEAAISLREGMSLGGDGDLSDWLFLALAEHRLGHAGIAKDAAAKARSARSSLKLDSPWDRAEVELLGAEMDAALQPPGK